MRLSLKALGLAAVLPLLPTANADFQSIEPSTVLAYPTDNGKMDWSAAAEEASACAELETADEKYLASIVLFRTGQTEEAIECSEIFGTSVTESASTKTKHRADILKAFVDVYRPSGDTPEYAVLKNALDTLSRAQTSSQELDWTSGTLIELISRRTEFLQDGELSAENLRLADQMSNYLSGISIESWRIVLSIKHILLRISDVQFEYSADVSDALSTLYENLLAWSKTCEQSDTCESLEPLYFRYLTLHAIVRAEAKSAELMKTSGLSSVRTISMFHSEFDADCSFQTTNPKQHIRWPVSAKKTAMASGVLVKANVIPGKKLKFVEVVDSVPSFLEDRKFTSVFKKMVNAKEVTFSSTINEHCLKGGQILLPLSVTTKNKHF